ncbi:MAG: toxin-antitoxin system HicB family antitoxin [Vitreimonas sp.]
MSDTTVTVRLPEGVHREVERLARESGVSAEQFVASAAAEKVSAILDPEAYFAARAARANDQAFDRIMHREGGVAPRLGDEAD